MTEGLTDKMPSVVIECRTCGVPWKQLDNMLTGKPILTSGCRHHKPVGRCDCGETVAVPGTHFHGEEATDG